MSNFWGFVYSAVILFGSAFWVGCLGLLIVLLFLFLSLSLSFSLFFFLLFCLLCRLFFFGGEVGIWKVLFQYRY